MPTKVSIIIPTLNEERLLPDLLSDLKKQTYPNFEVIVVDGGSSDSTQKIVKKNKSIRLITTKKNPGHQRSHGAKKATGKLLLFLDADVRLLRETFIQDLVFELESQNVGTVCPYYWPYQSSKSITSIYAVFNLLFFLFQKLSASGAGSCILTSAATFKSVGGFSAQLRFDDIAYLRAAAEKDGFCMAPVFIHVSDRRFRKYGSLKMFTVYLALSIFFLFGLFKAAEVIEYRFGKY